MQALGQKIFTEVTMPAGAYWVGDPCYAVEDDDWMPWLRAADFENERRFLLAEIRGRSVLGIGTAHGDGEYFDQEGHRYPVDAGLIGLVPVELAGDGEVFGSRVVTFDSTFTCSYDEDDGTIVLGDIRIETDPDEPYEEDDDDEEEEDEDEDE